MMRSRKKADRQQKQKQYRARQQAQAKAAATAMAPTSARNVQKEPGRPLTVRDVVPYARPGCQKCSGKGMVGYRKVGETRGAEPCKCATTRFFKAHPEIIVTEQGVAFWPVDEAPEEIAARKEKLAKAKRQATCSGHSDPDNSGQCIKCGAVLDPPEADATQEERDAYAELLGATEHLVRRVHGETPELAQIIPGISNADAAAAGFTVHHLHQGQTACPFGRDYDVPASWPPGHLWTGDPKQTNCQGCLDILAVRETFAKAAR